MEKYDELRLKSLKNLSIANHMLTMTYPMLEEPKILLNVIENIFLGMANAMGALLYYERKFKRIPPFSDNFESKYNTFKLHCLKRYGFQAQYLSFIQEVKNIVRENKHSPVTFSRKNKFIICSKEYRIKELNYKDLKEKLEKAKLFIHKICSILEKNERIYCKRKRRIETY